MNLDQARKEIARLKSAYPNQDFVIMGEVGTVTRSERVTVKIQVPEISSRNRKRAKQHLGPPNIIPLRKELAG